ncbi:hypothetical protein JCM10207_001564 [Rhodosporidiobolus poonsookiae]
MVTSPALAASPAEEAPASLVRPWLIAITISLGAMVFGFDTGCISGALIMPDFERRFGDLQPDGTYALGSSNESLIVSFLSIGTFVGAFGQTLFTDRIGRKWSIVLWAAIFIVGSVIQTASEYSIWQLCVGRLVAGLGVGALSGLVSLFAGEIAPQKLRGPMLSLYSVMNTFGTFLSYMVSWGSADLPGSASWRIPVGLQIPIGLLLLIGMLFVPDSPRRLLYRGREAKARAALAYINGLPLESKQVDALVHEIQDGLAKENEGGRGGWGQLMGREVRSRVIHGMMLQTFQQFAGQNFYYYYGATFFQQTGTGLNAFQIQAIMGSVALLFVFPALWIVDSFGRRKGLITGAAGECVCALIAALVGHFMLAPQDTPDSALTSTNRTGGAVVITFAFLHLAFFNSFIGPLPWAYLGESFPTRIRAKAVALGTMSNWFWNFIIAFFSPRITDRIGPLILLIFSGMMFCLIFYTYFLLRETRGLSLEQVDEMYRAKVKPWRSSKWQPTSGPARGVSKRKAVPSTTPSPAATVVNGGVPAAGLGPAGEGQVTEVYGTHQVEAWKSGAVGRAGSAEDAKEGV